MDTRQTYRPYSLETQAYYLAGFISVNIWSRFFSGPFQLFISSIISRLYNWRISRYFIPLYCFWQYGDKEYYKKFRPGSGGSKFLSFQDYFTRSFFDEPILKSDQVWPVEGYLCESGQVGRTPFVKVKGEPRHIATIFGKEKSQIPENYYFKNVFLHNNNYHHIHAPVSGVISRIEHIPGELLLLRPWAYKNWPSLPALTNERVNVDIRDDKGHTWLLSIVGGPLVATIKLAKDLQVSSRVIAGGRIAAFELGSTCCMVSPVNPNKGVGSMVNLGECLSKNGCLE